MDNIPLKILIIDPVKSSRDALHQAINKVDAVISVNILTSIQGAMIIISEKGINAIFIDPISLDLDSASDFILDIRKKYKEIVFVLYYHLKEANQKVDNLYAGERTRFRKYYKLDKNASSLTYEQDVQSSIRLCQSYLQYSLTAEKINKLRSEVTAIQDKATNADESVAVPIKLLEQIKEQLNERQRDTKRIEQLYKNAEFLGSPSTEDATNSCFVIMPYSQEWSAGVEKLIKEVCNDVGFEFRIAKTMEKRFVPHDIWQGITRSSILVADLTGANANVSYEVGLADAIGRDVILICQNTDVPFDFLGHRLIVYKNSLSGSFKLREELKERLKSIKKDEGKGGSP